MLHAGYVDKSFPKIAFIKWSALLSSEILCNAVEFCGNTTLNSIHWSEIQCVKQCIALLY